MLISHYTYTFDECVMLISHYNLELRFNREMTVIISCNNNC